MVKILTINICLLLSFGFAAGLSAQTHFEGASRVQRDQATLWKGKAPGDTSQTPGTVASTDGLKGKPIRHLELGLANSYIISELPFNAGYSGPSLVLGTDLTERVAASLALRYWLVGTSVRGDSVRRFSSLKGVASLKASLPRGKNLVFAEFGYSLTSRPVAAELQYGQINRIGYRRYLTNKTSVAITLDEVFLSEDIVLVPLYLQALTYKLVGLLLGPRVWGVYHEAGIEICYKIELKALWRKLSDVQIGKGG